ncbi:SDR family oxidoreductase [Anaerobacillus alkaliphilus]|uniref:SDR family oxidoreductase n=1 Tax=Anaerobacillus alkaliphilus TaxID=1548597 RepID=A0A4Q0VND7_9BACI|nr:SDR family oxidoreductase [Anaerobacillus alkaliphilus]RXI96663.1 SDR family oxidoreductase [Anaerobacillus alkaliphilus]
MNILVTGANRGLGLSFIKLGLEKGYQLFAGVRTLDNKTTKALLELKDSYKNQLHILQLDVTDEQSVALAANSLKESGQTLDVIINNAAVLEEREQTVEELDIEACMNSFNINTLGPMRVVKHFLPLLEVGTKQSIVNISSNAASLTHAYSGDYPYGLSKVALNMFSEKISRELKEKNIRVYSIHPGWMKTDMGGEQAHLEPLESAIGIYDIIEQKIDINSVYIDYQGKRMDF